MKFLKYNIGIIITAIFMAAMTYQEFANPKYGKANVPKVYLAMTVGLIILLVLIYFKFFHRKAR